MSLERAELCSKGSEAGISLTLVVVAFFAHLLLSDAFMAPAWYDRPHFGFGSSYWYQGSALEAFVAVGIFAVPLALWHALEAFSRDDEHGSRASQFFRFYPAVLILLILGLISIGLIASGFAGWLSCYQPEPIITTESGNQFGFWCTPEPMFLAPFTLYPALLALVSLTLAKAGFLVVRKFL